MKWEGVGGRPWWPGADVYLVSVMTSHMKKLPLVNFRQKRRR